MNFFFVRSAKRPSLLAKGLTAGLAACLFVGVGCSETDDEGGSDAADSGVPPTFPQTDASSTPPVSTFDAGSFTPPVGTFDAGTPTTTSDAATPVVDSGAPALSDAGGSRPDASTTSPDAGGFSFPDLGGLFPTSDAGTTPPTTTPPAGGRDVNGPCKDLNLICFDFVDMWINAECATCNSGKGCQGCAIPFAY